MNHLPPFKATVAQLAVVALCLLAPARAAAQAEPGAVPFAGTQILRRYVLHDLFKLEPVTDVDELRAHPGEGLLIVFGETATLEEEGITAEWLEGFVERGGSVLIASDRPGSRLPVSWGSSIAGQLVHQDARAAYRGQEGCPLLRKFAADAHPLFMGLTRGLATNQPSYLDQWNDALRVLAAFPPNCWIARDHGRGLSANAHAYIAGSAADHEVPGRVVCIAGHGIFMNGMMAQRDNDNFAFACNCIRWLSDGGKRKRVLLLEEGSVRSRFDVPLKETGMPPVPPSQVVNKLLRGLEEENFFDRLILKLLGLDPILRAVVLSLTALLLVYAVSRLLRGRYRIEAAVPLLGVGQPKGELPVMSQRNRDVVRGGNLWEAARDLARCCFDKLGEPWQAPPAQPPPLVVGGGWRRRLRLAWQVRTLWGLAHGPSPVPVTPRRFAVVAAQVREVQAALADGTLRFGPPPASHEKRQRSKAPTIH